MINYVLIKLIKFKWRLLYKQVLNKKISTPEYAKRRKCYENLIIELEKNRIIINRK